MAESNPHAHPSSNPNPSWGPPPRRGPSGLGRALIKAIVVLAHGGWLGLLLLTRPRAPEATRVALAQRCARRSLRALGVEVEIEGKPPKHPFILVSNHRGYLDVGVLQAAASVVFLAKAEIGRLPLLGWVVRLAGTVFVERDSRTGRRQAVEGLRQALEKRQPVALFPEGKTSAGGDPGPFRFGSFKLAHEIGVPVVPAAIEYSVSDAAWVSESDLSLFPHFFKLFSRPAVKARVAFGPPLLVEDPEHAASCARRWIVHNREVPQAG